MSSDGNLPWIIKYRPRRLDDYVDQEEAKAQFVSWIKDWLRGSIPSKRAVLLYGPPGVGKTSLVEAVAGELGLEVHEMNASDFRRREDIERSAARAARSATLSGRPRLVLIDEVDGMSGAADKGGLEALVRLIETTRHPLVLTANDPWRQDLKPLRDSTLMIQLKKLKQRDVVEALRRICQRERIRCEDSALALLHDKNSGDLRSCINDLQALAETYGEITEELVRTQVFYRDRELDPFDTVRTILTARYLWQSRSAVTHSRLDHDSLIEWLSENAPLQLTDPEDLYRAFEALSRADVYRGLIVRTGSWDLLAHVINMLGPAVTLSRRNTKFKWVAYRFPQKIKMLSELRRAREALQSAAKKIAEQAHVSTRTALSEYIPMIRAAHAIDSTWAAYIMKRLGLSPEEASVVVGDPEAASLVELKLTELEKRIAEKRGSAPRARPRGKK
ncbi:MAG: replication factor C large subunit [Fervidicoccaceae archaeon]